MKTSYEQINAYTTLDGSEIRELMHPDLHGNHNQSLAEASIKPGHETRLHRHDATEELYHVLCGSGMLTLENDSISVTAGDTIHIPPGAAHKIRNSGDTTLKILCCCSPPYRHEDTEMLASKTGPGQD
jgi:mannose-6-phosphate isomerase-like protein (cupin superfamily)